MALRQRLHARAGASARSRRRPGRARCSTWWPTASASQAPRRCAWSRRSKLALKRGSGPRQRLRAAGAPRAPDAETSGASRPACTAPRATCRYADPQPALFSFNSAVRRLRDLPRLRPRDRRRPRPRHPRRRARRCAPARSRRCRRRPGRRCQDDLMRYAGEAGIPRDTAWSAADRSAARLGHRGLAELERQVEPAVVRRQALLRVPRVEGVQDAHPRAAVEVPQLHAVPGLRRRAPEDRSAAVAPRHEGGCRRGAARRRSASCRSASTGRARSSKRLPGLTRARPDAAADRPPPPLLRSLIAAEHAARRRAEAAARRDAHAPANTSATSASAISRSTARAARCPAARCSAST